MLPSVVLLLIYRRFLWVSPDWYFHETVTYLLNESASTRVHSIRYRSSRRYTSLQHFFTVFLTCEFHPSHFDSSNLCIMGEKSQSPYLPTGPDYGVFLPIAGWNFVYWMLSDCLCASHCCPCYLLAFFKMYIVLYFPFIRRLKLDFI